MTKFRPCIDLHNGQVKQIVGGTLSDDGVGLKENFVADESAAYYAAKYRDDNLHGGHVIQLGNGNHVAALESLSEWPNSMQLGGGVNIENAVDWISAGASHVIVTSWLFDNSGNFLFDRLKSLSNEIGKERLVVDLSCRRTAGGWTVAMNRWQHLTNLEITETTLDSIAEYCSEYLIHAADVEGLCNGVDLDLVKKLGAWGRIPMTYAGGVCTMQDLDAVSLHSMGNLDITVGSALDIFGGEGIKYEDLIRWNNRSISTE